VMGRMANLLAHQKRFVRDTSHQLRTPLAVLKVQVQSALRGDVEPQQALIEIEHTVQRATELANQMLALAKVEQLRQQADVPVVDWAAVVRAVALDLSPLITDHRLVFEMEVVPLEVRSFEWALRELTRNLMHNAIKNTPDGSHLVVTLAQDGGDAKLLIADNGPGISQEMRQRLFQAFSSAETVSALAPNATSGSGLGLAICHEIVSSLGGRIALTNRLQNYKVHGLNAVVFLPLAHNSKQ
jgi:two-component system, OmpR family, sensor histidine kinase TctE